MPTGTSFLPTSTALLLPHQQQTTEANYNNLPIQNLNPECDNAEITKAMLAVISSPSSSVSSQMSSTFKEYTSALAPSSQMKASSGKQNMLKRSVSIMRNIQLGLRDELTDDIPHTSSFQLHHKISERKRREKLNESFQELRSLLPPGSKKDKASVLSNTLDYLSNLKIEVMNLKQKNEVLEARASNVVSEEALGDSSDENSVVQISSVPSESTSEVQEIEMQVTVSGDFNIIDLILDILEYLKLVHEVTLLSMDANTKLIQTKVINIINFRLKTKSWREILNFNGKKDSGYMGPLASAKPIPAVFKTFQLHYPLSYSRELAPKEGERRRRKSSYLMANKNQLNYQSVILQFSMRYETGGTETDLIVWIAHGVSLA